MSSQISYIEQLSDSRWKAKREEIIERDHGKCVNCGQTENLQVHHKQYHINKWTGMHYNPWEYENKYLVTLCEKCHEWGHQHYKIPNFNI